MVCLPLLLFGGEVLYAFYFRVRYPFGLEWMEGDLLVGAHRLAHGQALYSRPDQWIAYFYPPLYLILWAPLVRLFGPVFWTGRLLSLACSILAGLGLAGYVRHRTGRVEPALIAMGMFWGFYQYTGQWLDLCRVDALMLAMVAGGLHAYARSRSTGSAAWRVAAVVLLGTSPLAKQNGSAFLLAVGLADFLHQRPEEPWQAWRRGCLSTLRLPLALARRAELLLAGVALTLFWIGLGQWLSDGWYWDYLYAMPARLEHRNLFVLIFVKPTLKHALPWVLGLLAGLTLWLKHGNVRPRTPELLLLLFGAFASLPVTFKYGAYYNNLLPLMLAFCAVGGVALGDAWAHGKAIVRRAAGALVVVQVLALLAVNRPGDWRPTHGATVQPAEQVLPELLAQLRGPVWILSHPYLSLQRGEPVFIKDFAALEFSRSGGTLPDKWYQLVRQRYYHAIIADYPLNIDFDLFATIADNYALYSTLHYGDEALPERRRALAPRSGHFTRPTYFWIPKGSPPPFGDVIMP